MKWQPIETAPINKPVLIRYYKGSTKNKTIKAKDWVIVEAIGTRAYIHEHDGSYDRVLPRRIYSTCQHSLYSNQRWTVTISKNTCSWMDKDHKFIGYSHIPNNEEQTVVHMPYRLVAYWQPLPEKPTKEEDMKTLGKL